MPDRKTAPTDHTSPEARAELRRAALEYHEFPIPGKVAIQATKQLVNQHDLSLAYSPGVAAPCEEMMPLRSRKACSERSDWSTLSFRSVTRSCSQLVAWRVIS